MVKPFRKRIAHRWKLSAMLIALTLVGVPLSGWSATQGSAGPTSSGTLDVNLIMGLNVRISGLADIALGTYGGTGDLAGDVDLCIGRTGVGFFGAGLYQISASGNGAPGNPSAFTLTNGASDMYYRAYFNDATGIANRQELTAGVAMSSQSGFGFFQILNYLFGCAVNNANISIVVPSAELQSGAGVYTGTLTLTLLPE